MYKAIPLGGKIVAPCIGEAGMGRAALALAPQHELRRTIRQDDLGYYTHRGLDDSSTFTYGAVGRSIDAWVGLDMYQASLAGQNDYRIFVLGPGDGNTEKGLVGSIVPWAEHLGMRLELMTTTLAQHPMSVENQKAIEGHVGDAFTFKPLVGNFDRDPFPEGVDLLYGIHSTTHSYFPLPLTEKIHNSLRPPTDNLPGGQALYMYGGMASDIVSCLVKNHFTLLKRDIDISVMTATGTPHNVAHMTRVTDQPMEGFHATLCNIATGPEELAGCRVVRGLPPIIQPKMFAGMVYDFALQFFMCGARNLFVANGMSPYALSDGMHRYVFNKVYLNIVGGQYVYPDAVSSVYGEPENLNAIREHGDQFLAHINGGVEDPEFFELARLLMME